MIGIFVAVAVSRRDGGGGLSGLWFESQLDCRICVPLFFFLLNRLVLLGIHNNKLENRKGKQIKHTENTTHTAS